MAAEQGQQKRGWERAVAKFADCFTQQGLTAADLPAAIGIYEVVGLVMAAGFWSLCYAVQPSQTVARPLVQAAAKSQRAAAMHAVYARAMVQATATVRRMSWLGRSSGADPARLTVSLAESVCLRNAIKPATFPFKLWALCKLTLQLKRWQGGGRRGGAANGGGSGSGISGAGKRKRESAAPC